MKKIAGEAVYTADIYLRLSDDDGDKMESNSIKNQREFITEFLKSMPEIRIHAERKDDGFSGVDFFRPGLQEVLQDVRSGAVNCVVVKDLSRLGSPKANRLKEIAKAMNIREEIFLMPDETPIDLLRILIWYDWEHEGVLQLATSRTANTPPRKTVSPIIYSEQLPLNRLLLDWADKKRSLSVRKITRADYLEWMLQWPPRLP